MAHEITGTIVSVDDVWTSPKGFRKRSFVIEEDDGMLNTEWRSLVPMVLTKDNVGLIGPAHVGQLATFTFDFDGRKWKDPKTGRERVFLDLRAWKVHFHTETKGDVPSEPPAPEGVSDSTFPSDDVPF